MLKPYRVLLVDDHKVYRSGLRLLLECLREFNVVGEAVNGKEAVEKATMLKPDLVIMDVFMPVMNGFEATRRIMEALPETRVVVLTAYESEAIAQEAFKAGACAYVGKLAVSHDLPSVLTSLGQDRLLPPKAQETRTKPMEVFVK